MFIVCTVGLSPVSSVLQKGTAHLPAMSALSCQSTDAIENTHSKPRGLDTVSTYRYMSKNCLMHNRDSTLVFPSTKSALEFDIAKQI